MWLFSNPTSEGLLCTPADTAEAEMFILHPVGSESVFVFKGCEALLGARDHTISGWLHATQNLLSIDVIIFTDGLILTIQSAIAPTHDAEDMGSEPVAQVSDKAFRHFRSLQWHHMFITHSDDNAQELRRQLLLGPESNRILVYFAVLNPANLRLTPNTE
jgi:hypothetical protein